MIWLCSLSMIVFGSWLAPPDVSAISGNGALTAGVNPFGRVSLCRWPSPSYFNQVSYSTISSNLPMKGVRPQDGLQWGFRSADKTMWLREAPWNATQHYAGDASTVIETIVSLPDESSRITQRMFAHGTLRQPQREMLPFRKSVQEQVLEQAAPVAKVHRPP